MNDPYPTASQRGAAIFFGLLFFAAYAILDPGPFSKASRLFILGGIVLILTGIFPSLFRAVWRRQPSE
jgi:hypothetical protein